MVAVVGSERVDLTPFRRHFRFGNTSLAVIVKCVSVKMRYSY